jgi:hypothetical protein
VYAKGLKEMTYPVAQAPQDWLVLLDVTVVLNTREMKTQVYCGVEVKMHAKVVCMRPAGE